MADNQLEKYKSEVENEITKVTEEKNDQIQGQNSSLMGTSTNTFNLY